MTTVLIGLIRVYRLLTSPFPSPCRYEPTCSAYAIEALDRHGTTRGIVLAVRRVLRCHPWGSHGIDPVPEPKRSGRR